MENRISRRDIFFKTAGAAAGLGAVEAFAVRKVHSHHEITDEVLTQLQKPVEKMAHHIFTDIVPGNPASWDTEPLAKAIAQLAFLEGGIDEVDNVANFISERGLKVDIEEKPAAYLGVGVIGAEFVPSYGPGGPMQILLGQWVMQALVEQRFNNSYDGERGLLHELQHAVQQARDPDKFQAYRTASQLANPLIVTTYCSYSMQTILDKKFNRRGFFWTGIAGTAAAVLALGATRVLENTGLVSSTVWEREADAQAERLINSRSYDNIRGKLFFDFKD